MKTTPPAQHPLAGSSPVHTRIRGYSSPIAAPGNQRRRAAQRAPTWDAQPAFLCFSLPGQGDWQFPALTTWRTLSFLVITKVPGLWTILWPRDQWCDTAKGSGACESLGQTRHSRYTAYPPAGPRLHVSLLAARARAAQGLPPLRLELPKVTTPRNPASRVCFVCEEGTKHERLITSIDSILLQDVSTIKTISSTEMWPPTYVCNLDKFVPLLPETLFHFLKRFSWNGRMFYRSKQLIEHLNQQFKSLQAHSNR